VRSGPTIRSGERLVSAGTIWDCWAKRLCAVAPLVERASISCPVIVSSWGPAPWHIEGRNEAARRFASVQPIELRTRRAGPESPDIPKGGLRRQSPRTDRRIPRTPGDRWQCSPTGRSPDSTSRATLTESTGLPASMPIELLGTGAFARFEPSPSTRSRAHSAASQVALTPRRRPRATLAKKRSHAFRSPWRYAVKPST